MLAEIAQATAKGGPRRAMEVFMRANSDDLQLEVSRRPLESTLFATVGLLLAGAEPEELVTAVVAALRGQPGVAAGDAIGANVTLLTLVLGGLAPASPLTPGRRGSRYAAAAAAAGVVAWATLADGLVGRVEAASSSSSTSYWLRSSGGMSASCRRSVSWARCSRTKTIGRLRRGDWCWRSSGSR
jgi:hypothetical protein